jgi:hypothetical protein
MSPYEQLLHWVAERGGGTLSGFSEAHAWATGEAVPAHRTLGTMAALGQIEVDWAGRRWGAVDPTITLLPDAGGYGLVVGARTARLTEHLHGKADALDIDVQPRSQPRAPDAYFIAADSEQALQRLAEHLEVDYVHSVTERLASVLPSLDAMLRSLREPPIATHYGIERYDLDRGWRLVDDDRAAGLYRYEISGPRTLQLVDDEQCRYRVDLAVGAWAEARRTGRAGLLRWEADGVNGTLEAPVMLPLPTLHARTATLCSGLAPRFSVLGRVAYVNVPAWLAERIGDCLEQDVEGL